MRSPRRGDGMRQAAWCGLLVCAGAVAQTPAEAERDRLLTKLQAARQRAAATNSVTLPSSQLLLPADPAAARAQAVNLLYRPPDARQALTTFAVTINLLDDVGEWRVAARGAMVRRINTQPVFEHLKGLKTLV